MDTPTQYCEAINFQLLNIITSFFFILFAFSAYKKTNNKILPILLGFVGVGSILWHLTSFEWADLIDTLSITIFSLIATYLVFSKIFKNRTLAVFSLMILIFFSFFLEQIELLNGSLVYIFLLFILLISGIILIRKIPAVKQNIVTTLLVFLIAIIFRVIDPWLCDYIPFGTHFIWHILMAFVGYNLILALGKEDTLKKDVGMLK